MYNRFISKNWLAGQVCGLETNYNSENIEKSRFLTISLGHCCPKTDVKFSLTGHKVKACVQEHP